MADYARHRGCSQAAVSYAVKAGRITLVDGKVDPAKADKDWANNSRRSRPPVEVTVRAKAGAPAPSGPSPRGLKKNTNGAVQAVDQTQDEPKATNPEAEEPRAPTRRGPPPAPPSDEPVPEYQESRARFEAARAALTELQVQEKRGTLIEAAAVRAEFAKQLASIRDGLLNIPARLAPLVAAESAVGKVQTMIDAELRAVLAQLVEG